MKRRLFLCGCLTVNGEAVRLCADGRRLRLAFRDRMNGATADEKEDLAWLWGWCPEAQAWEGHFSGGSQ